ncbi:MAG TPA: aminotransferase class I/II-fold pyridoxal phosphate-dependent enzyme [Anaerolineae bacterium]|nr:aminotransferase class I/II-fold pyridoxal phosphate-dependent enzyme [Anaerolineae bacterium]
MRNFVSQKAAAIPPSGIRRFFDIAATMDDVISLGIGEPDFTTPDHIIRAGIKSLEEGETHYTSNSGILELREALAEHLENLYGVSYDPERELLVTVGVSEALYLALTAVLDPGDEVIVPQPCFVSYCPEVMFAGGKPVIVRTRVEEEFQVTAEQIEAAITPKTKALLIGYPNNPTGAVMSRERLLEVAELAKKHDLLVISDEIYDRLVYDTEHTCFPSLPDMRERTILLQGFSKDYAMTGWRIGYAAAPAEILGAMRKVHQYTIMSAPTTAQVAALQAIKYGEDDVQAMRAEYDRRRRVLFKGLNSIGLPTFEPRGAFYCFPKVTHLGMSAEDFCEKLLYEEKVAVIPGGAFGECGKDHVRACYATSLEKIEEALVRISRFVEKYAK